MRKRRKKNRERRKRESRKNDCYSLRKKHAIKNIKIKKFCFNRDPISNNLFDAQIKCYERIYH
jgi:hypothetical protein